MSFRTSPTDVEDADADDPEGKGCPRRWWYKRQARRWNIDVQSSGDAARDWGEEGHSQIERFLKGGPRPDRADVVQHLHVLPPPPLADLRVEQYSSMVLPGGIPCTTKQDLVHARPTSVAHRIDPAYPSWDPLGRVEVVDWKFPGSSRYLPRDEDLRRKIQPALYAADWHARGVELVRVTIVSFVRKPRVLEVASDLLDPAAVAPALQHAARVARLMSGWADLGDPEQVPGNRDACGAFGGCPWRRECSVARFDPLRQVLGDEAAGRIIKAQNAARAASPATAPGEDEMGFMDKINKAKAQIEEGGGGESAEDRAARERRESVAAELAAAMQVVIDAAPRYGRPQLSGRAAQLWAAYTGTKINPQAGLAGTGQLGESAIEDPSLFISLAEEIQQHDAPARAQHPSSPRPGDAPESNPAAHVEKAEAAKEKRKEKLEKSRAPTGPAVDEAVAAHDAAKPPASKKPSAKKPPAEQDLSDRVVLVDCVALSGSPLAPQRLESYCQDVLAETAAASGMEGVDVRLSSGEVFGFGKWKVAVEVAAHASASSLPTGLWLLDSRGSELAEAVIAGLVRAGACVIRGYR